MAKGIIIADTREKKNAWNFPEDDLFQGTVTAKVDHGDYAIQGLETRMFIERKASIAEVAGNMTEPRIKKLLEAARSYQYRFMIIEASYDDIWNFPHNEDLPSKIKKRIRIGPGFILSFLTRCMVEYGITVILAEDHKKAEMIAYRILKEIYLKEKDNIIPDVAIT